MLFSRTSWNLRVWRARVQGSRARLGEKPANGSLPTPKLTGSIADSASAMAEVTGEGCYASLRFESGVHRVQRVPTNDVRIHTSTASVVVLPGGDQIEFTLDENEVRIDAVRASGAGGQHVDVPPRAPPVAQTQELLGGAPVELAQLAVQSLVKTFTTLHVLHVTQQAF